jgi:ribonuclease P protein component
MIPKKQRVPRESIAYILRKGEETATKLFIIRYIKNSEGLNRFRTIVSKKIEPKAVARNKLRRQIYEAIRINEKDTTTQKDHFDLIMIPKKRIREATFEDIKKDTLTISHGEIQ